jgi:3-dehydroquinate synthase
MASSSPSTMVGLGIEMYEIYVSSKSGTYAIHIENSVDPISIPGIAIVDSNTRTHLVFKESAKFVLIVASEENKTLNSCESLIITLNDLGLSRNNTLSAVGGGTTQDLATLTSSLYMRGVEWVYYPTTLMSMTDSCIGGKSAINAGDRKNLIGNFYPPSKIQINTRFLETNSDIDIVNGLSEAVKICFAKSASAFERYLSMSSSLTPGNDEDTARLIHHTLSTKKWFVEIDEFDVRERQLLNFGHSFAHALESATNYSIPHGTAVAIGMIAALKHPTSGSSEKSNLLIEYSLKLLDRTKGSISDGLQQFDEAKFVRALDRDKKNSNEYLRLVLLNSNDELEITSLARNDYQLQIALASLNEAISEVLL